MQNQLFITHINQKSFPQNLFVPVSEVIFVEFSPEKFLKKIHEIDEIRILRQIRTSRS